MEFMDLTVILNNDKCFKIADTTRLYKSSIIQPLIINNRDSNKTQ